jgi:hypothetical protein
MDGLLVIRYDSYHGKELNDEEWVCRQEKEELKLFKD